jgi:hypothetical protein
MAQMQATSSVVPRRRGWIKMERCVCRRGGTFQSRARRKCGYIYGSSRIMIGVLLLLHATVMSPVSAAVSTAISLRTGPIFPIPDAQVRFPSLKRVFEDLWLNRRRPSLGVLNRRRPTEKITDLVRYRRTARVATRR